MVYTAEHLSLAMVDYLAHLDPDRPPTDFVLAKADVPDDVNRVLLTADDLPPDWRRYPEPQILADLGSDFVKQEKAAIMIVPSALATVENNWLLNPVHQDFRRIRILDTESFQYGPRLLRI
jgi:RES domain-containing protein